MADGAAADRFAIRRWDDGIAVFDRRSGATHCMNAASAVVFELMAADPTIGDAALLRGIGPCMPHAPESDRRAALDDARERLRAARLIGP